MFFALLLTALIGGTWAYFKIKELKKPSQPALMRLPSNCSLHLMSNDLFELNNRLNTRSLIVDRFSEFAPLSSLIEPINSFCQVASGQSLIEESLHDNPIHFAIYPGQKNWLISLNLKELGQEREFFNALGSIFAIEKIGQDLYHFQLHPKLKVFMSLQNGGICISESKELLLTALDPKTSKLGEDENFKKHCGNIEDNELLHFYIAHEHYSKEENKEKINFNFLQSAGFSSGSLELEPSQLVFNGTLFPENSKLFNSMLNQRSKFHHPEEILPEGISSFTLYGLQDFTTLRNDSQELQKNKGFWNLANDSAMYDLEPLFYSNIGSAICEFGLQNKSSKYLSALLQDSLRALEQLSYMNDSLFALNGFSVFRIYTEKNTLPLFEPLSKLNCAYAFVHKSTLYVAESLEDIGTLSLKFHRGELLEHNENFKNYCKDQLPEEYSIVYYNSPEYHAEKIHSFYPSSKKGDASKFNGLKHALISLETRDSKFKLRVQCVLENEVEESGETFLWTLKLDTICKRQAENFVNHTNGEQELLIQDEANTLYLVNSKGKTLWKKHLKEKIQSKIHMVDMFKNRKNQMLFSTDNFIHLIDRNGKYVENYPVRTPSKISSPLVVFDYESTREYRLFFSCENLNTYNYTINGIKNEGFTPLKTATEVQVPVHYFKVGENDYLLAIDSGGTIYGYSRRGELRFQLKNKTLLPSGEIFVDVSTNLAFSKIIFVDEKNSAIHKISLTDKKEIIPLKTENEIFTSAFTYVDENKSLDLVSAGLEEMYAHNLNGNLLFTVKTPIPLSKLNYYSDQSHSLYYGWSSSNEELWLYENKLNESKIIKSTAMPFFSNLFRDNKIYIVFSEGDQLNCFTY